MFGVFLTLVMDAAVLLLLLREASGRKQIEHGLKEIAAGDLDYKIDLTELQGEDNLQLAGIVNSLGEGMKAAVQEQMKSERLKADLITNVSHDIKTPLTSIINYVDLLKRENIENEKAKDYIRVLDEKSQRLKQLTEDLVEASKISSGNIKLEFMNLNQSAHGDREFGHIVTRMRKNRKVVVGHWQDEKAQKQIASWMRVAAAWADAQDMLIIRFGDQMNNVAVTDGDKVSAEQVLGYHVDYYPINDVMTYYNAVDDADVKVLIAEYFRLYDHDAALEKEGTEAYTKVWNSAKAEIAIRRVLKDTGAKGFTTNFNDLGDFDQIPGLASQRLMAEGYGFGAEGDWKTAALYRTTWFMSQGMPNGCSFLEDYTLNFDGEKSAILQAHMLEVCPLIAEQKPKLEVHRLSIGIDSETARLVFTSKQGKGVAATIVDLGNRFRLIVNKVECIKSKPLPKLPVASALWIPMPNLEVGAAAWILAGGTHHTSFSYDLTVEDWGDFAEMAGIEMIVIDENTTIREFKKELRMNEVYYMLNKALC